MSRRWADVDDPHLRLNGWDPTMAHTSIRDRARRAAKTGEVPVERHGKAWGIVLDRRHVPPTEALSSGVFFSGEPDLDSDVRFLTAED
ncbi:MAG: hypothetical protein JRI25_30065 [Deltaproteobacteria bacterium]|nr:hypothetical protein [Deltaproteobacteria bacterium]